MSLSGLVGGILRECNEKRYGRVGGRAGSPRMLPQTQMAWVGLVARRSREKCHRTSLFSRPSGAPVPSLHTSEDLNTAALIPGSWRLHFGP